VTGPEFGGVDIDRLADYIGGVLTGTPDESVVAALIADDPAWHAAYESLGGGMALVGAELGRLGPEPMPAELATRLAAMFTAPAEPSAAEGFTIAEAAPVPAELAAPPVPHLAAVRGDDPSEDGARRVPPPVRPKAPAARRGRRMRWAAPIAVAAGLVAFVGFGLDYLAGRGGTSSDKASSAGVADQGAGSAMASSPNESQLLASGTNYTIATLGNEPIRPMTAPEANSSTYAKAVPDRAIDRDPALQSLARPEGLQECLDSIERANAHGAISVTSVDYARFNGDPAVVVRFTAANGAWAWASGPTCGSAGGGAATLGKVPVR
jgi:hypothetical protein